MRTSVIKSADEIALYCDQHKKSGRTVGVVPTMGALHAGHLSLVQAALESTDVVIATIFVNPTQFAEGEDLDQYPRPFEADLEKLAGLNVHAVFAPDDTVMYPEGFSTGVTAADVGRKLEGEFRPTHFDGVVTVVLKLLNLTRSDRAFFGQKDFQQLAVIRKMVTELNVPTEIVGCPIVREPDGLALSSRNVYLSDDERQRALSLHAALTHVRQQIEAGDTDGYALMSELRQMLIDGGVDNIDYAAIANPQTLEIQDEIQLPVVALVAAYVGKTRLIDNVLVG